MQHVTVYCQHISALAHTHTHQQLEGFTPARFNTVFNNSNSSRLNGKTIQPLATCFTCLKQKWAEDWKRLTNQIRCGDMAFPSDGQLRNPWKTACTATQKVNENNKRQKRKFPSLAQWRLNISSQLEASLHVISLYIFFFRKTQSSSILFLLLHIYLIIMHLIWTAVNLI